MKRRRKQYEYPKPGDVVSVPLSEDVEALGVVLNVAGTLVITAFLDFVIDRARADLDWSKVEPRNVHDVYIHGPLGFDDEWRVVGPLKNFERSQWPPLEFYEVNLRRVVELDPQSLHPVNYVPRNENYRNLPEYGTSGDVYVCKVLARSLLGSTGGDGDAT